MSDDTRDLTPEELAEFHQLEEWRQLTPHQRDAGVRLAQQTAKQQAWVEENFDWMMDHPELGDGDE